MYLFNMEKAVKFEHSPPVGKMGSFPPPNVGAFRASLVVASVSDISEYRNIVNYPTSSTSQDGCCG